MAYFRPIVICHIQEVPANRNYCMFPDSRLNMPTKQPIYFLPVLWNEWVKRLPVNGSKYQVKRYIKTTLLQHYASEVICNNERCTECGPE